MKIIFDQTYRLLQHADVALVTSGTATLETALFRVPQVVCYHTPIGKVVSFLRRHILTVKFISLVNLIADREVVKELVACGRIVLFRFDFEKQGVKYRQKQQRGDGRKEQSAHDRRSH